VEHDTSATTATYIFLLPASSETHPLGETYGSFAGNVNRNMPKKEREDLSVLLERKDNNNKIF
jgi:hypothetical protein